MQTHGLLCQVRQMPGRVRRTGVDGAGGCAGRRGVRERCVVGGVSDARGERSGTVTGRGSETRGRVGGGAGPRGRAAVSSGVQRDRAARAAGVCGERGVRGALFGRDDAHVYGCREARECEHAAGTGEVVGGVGIFVGFVQ